MQQAHWQALAVCLQLTVDTTAGFACVHLTLVLLLTGMGLQLVVVGLLKVFELTSARSAVHVLP